MKGKIILAASLAITLTFSQGFCLSNPSITSEEDNFTISALNSRQPAFQQTPIAQVPTNQQPGKNIVVAPINQVIPAGNLNNRQFSDLDIDSDDPMSKLQWYLKTTNAYLLWDEIDDQDDTVYVAVLDTGVDYTHVDLENRVDEDEGYDFVNDDDDAMDDNGHGTHVAGIIAAEKDNEEGIVGVTGDLDVVIIPIKVLDEDGIGDAGDVVDGIEYAVDLGYIDIINLSFGTTSLDDDDIEELEEALEEAFDDGIFVVAAAGNDSDDTIDVVPANVEGVFTIAASGTNNLLMSFSNYGDEVDIMSPGESIISTYLNGTYALQDGTSMAAPIVTGIVAMLKAYDEDVDVDDIVDYLEEGSNYLDIYDDQPQADNIGSGLIDAAGSYEAMTGEDIYDEDAFVIELESVTSRATTQTPQNLAPSMKIRSNQRGMGANQNIRRP